MGKEKTAEKRTAKILYVEQLKTAKEVAELVGVSENSICEWVKSGGWKDLRDNQINSAKKQRSQINEVITLLANRRIAIERELLVCDPEDEDTILRLKKEAITNADEAAKWNKAIMNLDKTNTITQETYLSVMDEIFSDLRNTDPKLFLKTLDFQESHIQKTQLKYQ